LNIHLDHISKRFRKQWIFQGITFSLKSGTQTAIIGNNGSGKSTLLHIISGYTSPSDGSVNWQESEKIIKREHVFRHVSICSPSVQLWNELTLHENYSLFIQFKQLPEIRGSKEFAQVLQLEKHLHQPLKSFSSGMRQRVKLGLAILSDCPILLLDEPCSHLDADAVAWYQSLLRNHAQQKTVIIASNKDERETFMCSAQLDINDYKS
jgi:ABC-type multidrug transport system ATPase subunit